jgi:hypothetical protein
MMALKTARSTFLKRWLRGSAIAVAMVAACMMIFGTATLKADCGVPGKHLMGSVFHPAAFITMAAEGENESHGHASVVGFWHVKLLNGDGSLYFQSLVQYHPDGMEAESADLDPNGGNYCMGVWKQEGRTITVYHIAWLYSGGNPFAYGVFRQTNTLDHDGDSYHGTFDLKVYDLTGVNELQEVKGTTVAHRIDFHHPFSIY